nr:hypothetical protein [uncultured Vibrio sp.]
MRYFNYFPLYKNFKINNIALLSLVFIPFSASSAWKSVESVDPITDVVQVHGYHYTSSGKSNARITCGGPKYVTFVYLLEQSLNANAANVDTVVRIDKNVPIELYFSMENEGRLTLMPIIKNGEKEVSQDFDQMTREMRTGSNIVIRSKHEYSNTQETLFVDLEGFNSTFESVRRYCDTINK